MTDKTKTDLARDDLAAKLQHFEELMAASERKVAALEAKIAEAAKPPAPTPHEPYQHRPIDYTARATMPREALKEMLAAVDDKLMGDLRADSRKPNPVTQGTSQLGGGSGGQGQVERGSGWLNERPISSPPGIEHCDRLMDMADAQDRADLERRLARSVKKE